MSKKIGDDEAGPDGRLLLDMYRRMLEIRRFEERASELYTEGRIPSLFHTYIGEEAVAVGFSAALRPDDYILSNHRGHGHCLSRGVSMPGMMAELLGKRTGVCKGKGGSIHMADFARGVVGCSGIVGGYLPLAPGIGLSIKLKGADQVCVCYFGDGASNQGTFHEAANFASIWKLPVIFVCENNHYAVTFHVTRSTSAKDIADRAAGYDMPGVVVDGMDVLAVHEVAREAVKRARKGQGPTLVECKTYRYRGHSRGDPPYGPYRSKEEVEAWMARDPLKALAAKVRWSEEELARLDEEVRAEVESAVKFALESPFPDPEEAMEDFYA